MLLIQHGRIVVSLRIKNLITKKIFLVLSVYLVKINENNADSTIIPLYLRPRSHSFSIFSLQYSADGSEIIGGSNDHYVYIYDLHQNRRTLRVNI